MSSKQEWETLDADQNSEVQRATHVIADVLEERRQQFIKWGSQAHKPDYVWSLILAEEFGELIDALSSQNDKGALVESVQLTAVSNAWAEAIVKRGTSVSNTDSFEQFVLAFFSNVGKMAKALLEEKNTDAFSYAMRTMASLNNLRDSISPPTISFTTEQAEKVRNCDHEYVCISANILGCKFCTNQIHKRSIEDTEWNHVFNSDDETGYCVCGLHKHSFRS